MTFLQSIEVAFKVIFLFLIFISFVFSIITILGCFFAVPSEKGFKIGKRSILGFIGVILFYLWFSTGIFVVSNINEWMKKPWFTEKQNITLENK